MLFAATPVPDAEWLPPALVLIFLVPIGAFLSLYALLTSFLFHTLREGIPVIALNVMAFGLNGCALLYLADSTYNGGRFLLVPLLAWTVALAAGAATAYRAVGMWNAEHKGRRSKFDEAYSSFGEDQ